MISISRLREVLKFPAERDQELDVIQRVLVSLLESRCAKPMERATGIVEVKSPTTNATIIYLERRPVESVSLVEERNAGSSVWTTLASSNYLVELGRAAFIEKLSGVWSNYVRVTYTGGYTWDTSIVGAYLTPPDIIRALETQAQFFVARFGVEKIATKSQSFEGTTVNMEEADLHPLFRAVVNKYGRRF